MAVCSAWRNGEQSSPAISRAAWQRPSGTSFSARIDGVTSTTETQNSDCSRALAALHRYNAMISVKGYHQ